MKKDKSHKKHPTIARPNYGLLARREISILGTNCDTIAEIAVKIQKRLTDFKVTYFDTDHHADASQGPEGAGLILNKKSHIQHSFYQSIDKFRLSPFVNDLDLLLINGNHEKGDRQIVVVDNAKLGSLERRLDQITAVELVLIKDGAEIPEFLFNKLSEETQVHDLSNECPWLDHIESWMREGIPRLFGLVLNGGKSTRMGTPKSDLKVEGETMLDRTYSLLSSVTDQTFYSIRTDQVEAFADQEYIEDRMNDFGPYGGIISAFMKHPDAAWLIMPVDMPKVNVKHLEELVKGRDPSKIATAFLNRETGFADPLLSIWEPKSFAHLLRFISLGYSCPRKVLINSDVKLLNLNNPEIFFNMNTPDQYKEVSD